MKIKIKKDWSNSEGALLCLGTFLVCITPVMFINKTVALAFIVFMLVFFSPFILNDLLTTGKEQMEEREELRKRKPKTCDCGFCQGWF